MSTGPRLIVTGARGFVAGSVIAQAGDRFEVHAVSRSALPGAYGSLPVHAHALEALDRPAWERLFDEVRPDAVLHTAALADIDYCEKNPGEAQAVNVEFTRALAGLSARRGVRMVFCSTDTVFDGEHAPYAEDAVPGPLNLYARTKVEAERAVLDSGPRAVVARLALVIGVPVLGAGNSLVARLFQAWREGKTTPLPSGEVRTPVDVITLGRALLELAASAESGCFHLAGNTRLNRLELGRELAAAFGFSTSLVSDAPPAAPRRAPRPRDVSLANGRARALLRTPMLALPEALALMKSFAPPLSP